MKNLAAPLTIILLIQATIAKAEWAIIGLWSSTFECTGDPSSQTALKYDECFNYDSSSVQTDGTSFQYWGSRQCPGTASASEEDIESCFEWSTDLNAKVLAKGLSQPVNSDYPLATATFTDDEDCTDYADILLYLRVYDAERSEQVMGILDVAPEVGET
eukprot:CAMPEP_0114585762 /NCGR_PEP_ID=MMETSP0125-20121206/9204_1 /TAXON_ID=485358 ORGANISM="Aristerostoma sp., Strain ATCC 50986" /NCGR_SAMPLE_ID=MMETSP0125 /ASSEMBLY_ACC=CAM_ASM_000245 /LENGTH=158 /DNA_ID=CAMNT_0001780961 /DNA_START=23 /DNA_END=499 /DNA_ORIENTATION=-